MCCTTPADTGWTQHGLSRHSCLSVSHCATHSLGNCCRLVDGARNKTAFVLPAFETYGAVYESAALADVLASKGKEFLIESMKKEVVGPFDHKRFPQG